MAWFRHAEGADVLDVLAEEPGRLVTTELVLTVLHRDTDYEHLSTVSRRLAQRRL